MHDSHQNIQILWKTYIYPLYLPVRLTLLTLPLYTPSLHSFVYYAALHCTGTAQLPLGYPLVTKKTFFSSVPPLYTNIPSFYIHSLDPFFTPSLSVTHPPLTLPRSLLHSFSMLLIQPPLYRPTLHTNP